MSTIVDFFLLLRKIQFLSIYFLNPGLIFRVLAATVYDNILLSRQAIEMQGSSNVARLDQVVKY